MKRPKIPKLIKRTVVTILILLVLFVGGGVAYVYFGGGSAPKDDAPAPVAQDADPRPKPVAPGPNAPEGVAINALTTPVKLGENASANIATNAGSKCTIIVTYGSVVSTDSGLAPKTADAYGSLTWTWTIAPTTPVGAGSVKVTCVYNGRSGVAVSSQVVTK